MKAGRYKIDMIFGTDYVVIKDSKPKRYMRLDIHETIAESNFKRIFLDLVEALRTNGEIGLGDSAECITFAEGSRTVFAASV